MLYNVRESPKYLPQTAARLVDEGLLVGADVLVLNACQNSNFVQGVFLLLVGELYHFHLL